MNSKTLLVMIASVVIVVAVILWKVEGRSGGSINAQGAATGAKKGNEIIGTGTVTFMSKGAVVLPADPKDAKPASTTH